MATMTTRSRTVAAKKEVTKAAVGISAKSTDENIVALKGIKKSTAAAAPAATKRTVLQELTNREKKPALAKAGVKRPLIRADVASSASVIPKAENAMIDVEADTAGSLIIENSSVDIVPVDETKHEPMDIDFNEEDPEDDDDIDKYDHDDPQFCTEYVPYIFAYWRKLEVKDACSPRYMDKQVDITAKHRTILVDWMAEVIVKFRLMAETMFLAVNIIDRFLQQKAVARQKLQLVGITAMLIASKFEEIYTPEVNDFIWITAKAYTREEVLKMERLILVTLEFNLAVATPLHFLRRFSKAARSDSRIHTLSKYISELSLVEYGMLEFLPSHVAAAAVYIARKMTVADTEPVTWTKSLHKHSQYSEEQIMPCVLALNELVQNAKLKYKATHRKYACPKLLSVSEIMPVVI
eukprot:TRINITY_DN2820_c0_g2_i1.p1 TRINITY_DN2820_c0_g2~~TRINITY_DN2820_c0_g2_i1.p1  ORF type:complete len:419 (+),score=174.31 TRINITY_DN2820_c0_g2_i1:33-1259(+)